MFDGLVAWLGEYGDKVQGAEALLAIILLIGGAAFFPIKLYFKRRESPAEVKIANPEALIAATSPPKGIQMDVESFVALQKRMRDEALESVSEAHGEEKKRLEEKIDALNARLADPDRALAEQQAIITSLEEKLSRQGNQLGGDAIIEAKAALEAGDFTKARNLFEAVAAQTAPDVKTHADAAFALGEIAETEIRWHDAAAHFATAAKLNPGFETLFKAREHASRSGDYTAAFRFGDDLLKWARSKGTQEQFAVALNEHASTLLSQGHYRQSEELFRQAIVIGSSTVFMPDSDYAIQLSNLANVLLSQGRHTEAEDLYREALEISAATVGTADPVYAIQLNNLANLLRAKGQLKEAEVLFRQAMTIGEATLGTIHPSNAIRLNNLAGVVQAQGRHLEAEGLYRRAKEICATTLGTSHPSYAIHLSNLANVVKAQGRYGEAEEFNRQALMISAATIGTAHPDYASHLNNLASVVEAQGRHADAEGLYRQALSISKLTIGVAHPTYANRLHNLANVVRSQGRYGEAERLYRAAIQVHRATLGDAHLDTRTVANNLLTLLLTHFPDDPEIPALQALLTPAP